MATYKQGILGSFRGKVGTVIGTYWKGRAVMRSVSPHVHNPRTPLQEAVRARLAVVSTFVSSVLTFVNEGFRQVADSEAITAANVAMRVNLAQAVTGSGTEVAVDYTRVRLAQGALIGLKNATVATASTGHSVEVEWDNNSSESDAASDSDQVLFCLFNADRMASTTKTSGVSRSNEGATLAYPSLWAGDTLYLYAATRSVVDDELSNSQLVGSVTAV